jgi:hypothetical protein
MGKEGCFQAYKHTSMTTLLNYHRSEKPDAKGKRKKRKQKIRKEHPPVETTIFASQIFKRLA